MNTRSLPEACLKTVCQSSAVINGRVFAICSKGQMNFLRGQARDMILSRAMDEEKTLSEEELNQRLDKWQETCGFITMPKLFEKLTPEQREEWKSRYRFSPIGVTRQNGA